MFFEADKNISLQEHPSGSHGSLKIQLNTQVRHTQVRHTQVRHTQVRHTQVRHTQVRHTQGGALCQSINARSQLRMMVVAKTIGREKSRKVKTIFAQYVEK